MSERDPRTRTRKLCRLLAERIGEVTSPGLGRWGPTWEIVAEPSDHFMDALAEFERTGEEEAMDQAKERCLEVLAAWKEAERRFQGTDNREEVAA